MCAAQPALNSSKPQSPRVDAREVDAVETAKRLARLRREVGEVRRTAAFVELDASRFTACVDEAGEEARAADTDPAAREVACDLGEAVLLAHPVLVTREADRGQSRGDDKQSRNQPHRQRIGTGLDEP